MPTTIYLADDHANIRQLLKSYLEKQGYRVMVFEDGDSLYFQFKQQPADLVILDIMMPGHDGVYICKRLRDISNVPIIMLTAKESDEDYITGIEAGGDDYLIKPFKPSLLMMRIKAILRRNALASQKQEQPTQYSFGNVTLDLLSRRTVADGVDIALTTIEFDVIKYFIERPTIAVDKALLLSDIWDYDASTESRVVDETVRRIRKKLRQSPANIALETVWGIGYRLAILKDSDHA